MLFSLSRASFVRRGFLASRIIFPVLIAGFLNGCVLPRDVGAVASATALKQGTLALMDKANDPYTAHAQEIVEQNASLQYAYDAARARPSNDAAVKMWSELLFNSPQLPGSGIYPRFVSQWKTKGTLKPAYIADKKETIGVAFDQIISLENAQPIR